jgi:cob(I)alamin adenosyltransferase
LPPGHPLPPFLELPGLAGNSFNNDDVGSEGVIGYCKGLTFDNFAEPRSSMVTLSRIYTKTGDQGETSLGDGSRVAKDHIRVAAYGSVDELNAVLGLAIAACPNASERERLQIIQNDLFDVGADLCVPLPSQGDAALRVTTDQVDRLERWIDRLNESLQPLQSFVLPGGAWLSAWLHLARTVCRRAERDVVTLGRSEPVNPQVLIYLNRLSDLLFVMARVANDGGRADVLWQPGAGRGSAEPKNKPGSSVTP